MGQQPEIILTVHTLAGPRGTMLECAVSFRGMALAATEIAADSLTWLEAVVPVKVAILFLYKVLLTAVAPFRPLPLEARLKTSLLHEDRAKVVL